MPAPTEGTPGLAVAEVARLLTGAGAAGVDPDAIRRDIAAGAPTLPDGTLNLLAYGAWLLKQARS